MFLFIKKTIVFLIPVFFFFLFPASVIYIGKEYLPVVDILKLQNQHPETIFGFAYHRASFDTYKKLLVQTKNPEVVALGTSRVMQIRKEFFIQPDTFTNASIGGVSLEDVELFVRELPEQSKLKIIILGFDQSMFYDAPLQKEKEMELYMPLRITSIAGSMSRRIYLDYFSHKYSISELIQQAQMTDGIGISALIHNNGFRVDGSYKYGEAELNVNRIGDVAKVVATNREMIKKEGFNQNYEKGFHLDLNLEKLTKILELCRKKNIIVIGFMPPYPQSVYQTMFDGKGFYHEMMTGTTKRVAEIFSVQAFPFFDLSSPFVFGGKDTEFVDEIHGTDVMYLKMMIYMVEHAKEMKPYVDEVSLKKILQDIHGDFLPF